MTPQLTPKNTKVAVNVANLNGGKWRGYSEARHLGYNNCTISHSISTDAYNITYDWDFNKARHPDGPPLTQ